MQNLMGCSMKGPSLITDHSLDHMSEKISSIHETPNARLSQDKLKRSIILMHIFANSPKIFAVLSNITIHPIASL